MRYVSLDVESCSELDLKEAGGWTYSKHPTTRGLCAALVDGDRVLTWTHPEPPSQEFLSVLSDPDVTFRGQNVMSFDRLMWKHCFHKKHGWPECPPVSRWDDTMHRCYLLNLPGDLESAGRVMKAKIQKDQEGHDLMMKMCKPARVTKNLSDPWRNHTPENLARLTIYCATDAKAEGALSDMLPAPSKFERCIIDMDADINDRGVMIDRKFVQKLIEIRDVNAAHLAKELRTITDGMVSGGTDLRGLAAWLSSRGIEAKYEKGGMDKKAMVEKILPQIEEKQDEDAARVVELRQMLGKTSLAKLDRILIAADPETDRLHWMYQYGGAHTTMRWAGRIVQTQNLPRGILKDADVDLVRNLIATIENPQVAYDTLAVMFGARSIFDLLSGMIRCAFIAKPGHVFVVADLSSIEPITTAWMAECPKLMKILLEKHPGFYRHMAAMVLDRPAETITAEERGDVGKKVGIGWTYGAGAKKMHGVTKLPLDLCNKLVPRVRAEYHEVISYWRTIDRQMMNAMRNPGHDFDAGPCAFRFESPDLRLRLPSGRWLTYHNAFIGDGKYGKAVFYWFQHAETHQWVADSVWGGSVLENLVQAADRDVQARNMWQANKDGLCPVLHSHDEIGCEVPVADAPAALKRLQKIMATPVSFMPGLPVGSAGFISPFYRK